MDLSALKTELTTDPEAMGYTGDDVGDADLLNAATRDGLAPLSSRQLLAWAGVGGRAIKLIDAAENKLNSDDVRAIAFVAAKMIEREDTSLDLNLADRKAMVAALVASGVLSQADSDSLYAAAATKVSRASELGLGTVTPSNVADARRA